MPVLLVTLVLALLAVPATASAAVPSLHGLQITGLYAGMPQERIDHDLEATKAAGANVVRSEVRWADLEPRKGELDEAYLALGDHLMAGARARGMKVLLTVVGTPCWNTTAPDPAAECRTDDERREAQRHQPRDLDAFAAIAATVAKRWAADLAALEVWNEPDQANELYWAGGDKVRRYAEMVKLAYPAIKAASPGTTVLAGGIVGYNGKFLQALYDQGIQGHYDGLSVHYYDLVLYSLGQIRATRKKAGDRTPLWLAEFGWTSCLSKTRKTQEGGHACVTPKVQAQNTLDVLAALGRQKDVKAAVLFTTRDDDNYNFGILDRKAKRKPLFAAVRRAFRAGTVKTRKLTLRLRRTNGQVVATGTAPAGDAYAIYAWKGRTLRYKAVIRADRFAHFRVKLARSIGTRGVAVAVQPVSIKGRQVSRRL